MRKALSLCAGVAVVLAGSLFPFAPITSAHCPQTPYDNTVFAPFPDETGFTLSLELVASGLTSPLKGTIAPGHPSRLFVVDQPGTLWAIDLNTGAKTEFLNVSSRLVPIGVFGANSFDERGLLGVAFHPRYLRNGLLYTYTSEPNAGPPTFPTTIPAGSTADHQNVLAEWRVLNPRNPASTVDPSSRRELLRVDWPQFNHDGGDLAFGPDGKLYITMGDGGGADDADGQLFTKATGSLPPVDEPIIGHQGDGNAQKLNTPLGKMLRIDVNGRNSANGQYGIPFDNPFVHRGGAVREIYAYGFRNPYRFSFDAADFDRQDSDERLFDFGFFPSLFRFLFNRANPLVGDVGQNDIEEVDAVTRGGNFGWNRREGTLAFNINGLNPGTATPSPAPANVVDPIAQYDLHHEGHSVIGGFVYHGRRFPQLRGRYVFGEFSGRVFNFPSGPHNFGRLLYLQSQNQGRGLHSVREFRGFSDAIDALGLSRGTAACSGLFPPTLAILGMGQDARGEIYALGNINGVPFGTDGVVLRIVPGPR